MNGAEIVEVIMGGVVLVLGYFLKIIHGDIKGNSTAVGKNAGEIKQLRASIDHEKELREQSYGNIMIILTEIKEDIKNLKS